MAKVLIIIPHDRFRDEEFEAVARILKEKGHTVAVGSSHHTEARGHFGLLVKPDIHVNFVEEADYDCLVFIGGRGIDEYVTDPAIINLVRNFSYERKPIAAIGMAVEILIYAGIISGKKVTCDNTTITKVQASGAYYTGNLTEQDGRIITATGVAAKDDFAHDIAKELESS